jgi:hypothetical protein
MTPEEKKIRRDAELIEDCYSFWSLKIEEALIELGESEDFETPADMHEQIKREEHLKYLLMHSEFEKKEMGKLDARIKRYIDENEE